MSLRIFSGEYLKSPVPVHFGLNWCSHGCFYCFANLNKPDRRIDNNDMSKMVKWFSKGSGPLEYWYLSSGFPMLVANDSDPLAKTNKDTFPVLHDLCRDLGVRIVYQTKGGERAYEDRIIADRPTMISVSIASDREDFLARSERGAPGFAARIDFIRRAKAAGHHVFVAIIPMVPAWWNDYAGSLEIMRDAGVDSIWHGPLHLSSMQLESMPKRQKDEFIEEVRYGMKKKKPDADAIKAMVDYADAVGFNMYDGTTSSKGDFFAPYFALGFPYMPTIDGIFARLREFGNGKPVSITLNDFNWLARVPGVPNDLSIYSSYCNSFGRSLRNAGVRINPRSFDDVHKLYWDWLNYPTPLGLDELKVGVENEDGETVLSADEFGNPLMIYAPGTDPDESEYLTEDAMPFVTSRVK